jgi:hypothetical protein
MYMYVSTDQQVLLGDARAQLLLDEARLVETEREREGGREIEIEKGVSA